MPVLRSREVIFHSFPSKIPRKRKTKSSPLRVINAATSSSKDVCSPEISVLGFSNSETGRGGRRRSLRLALLTNSSVGSGTVVVDGKPIESISGGDSGDAGADNTPPRRSLTEEEKGKRCVEVVNIDSSSMDGEDKGRAFGKYTAEEKGKKKLTVEGKYTAEEKGKKKLTVEDNLATADFEDIDNVVQEVFTEKDSGLEHNGLVMEGDRAGFSERKIEDRNRALALAKKFAVFREQERVEMEEDADASVDESVEEWPGPWTAAEKILRDQSEGVFLRIGGIESSQVEIEWTPLKKQKCDRLAPSLRELCMAVLCENAAGIQSLEGVPSYLCQQLAFTLCSPRKMDYHILDLLVSGKPACICVTDCSWASEDGFKKIFSKCDAEYLEVLKLDLCGRCMPDYILCSTLASSPNSLPRLTTVSFRGNYRLSDDGLKALACSAPILCSVNLSGCSLLTSTGIINLLKILELFLRELVLDYCSNIDPLLILPALKNLKMLEKLSVSGILSVKDKFVEELLSVHGPNMSVLGFADCQYLSLSSIKSIGENCFHLSVLDLQNLPKLNDKAIEHLARACRLIKKLKFRDSDCSDEAIAAFLEVSGKCLQDLALKNFKQVGHKTAIALSCHCCSSLQNLDLSFCRRMTDKALGLIVDHCLNLKILKLFGCTQVTNFFRDGHSNPYVEIIGLDGPILKRMEIPK